MEPMPSTLMTSMSASDPTPGTHSHSSISQGDCCMVIVESKVWSESDVSIPAELVMSGKVINTLTITVLLSESISNVASLR